MDINWANPFTFLDPLFKHPPPPPFFSFIFHFKPFLLFRPETLLLQILSIFFTFLAQAWLRHGEDITTDPGRRLLLLPLLTAPTLVLILPRPPLRLLLPPPWQLARVLLPWLLQQLLLLLIPLLLLFLPHAGMILELAPLLHLLHIQGQHGGPHLPKGPKPLAQGSLPVPGPRSPIHHLIKALLEISLWICPRLQSSGDLSSTAPLLSENLITVLRTCITKFIMIFRPLLKIQSSETLCG